MKLMTSGADRSWRRTAVAAPVGLLAAVSGLVLVAAPPASAGVAGHIIFPVAGTTNWTVPAGVTTAVFRLDGGEGGSETTYLGKTSGGGKGGQVSGLLTVTRGPDLHDQRRRPGRQRRRASTTAVVAGGTGGAGGGGDGGSGDDPGAGGGGASEVTLDSNALFMAAGWRRRRYRVVGVRSAFAGRRRRRTDWWRRLGVSLAEAQYGPARGGTQTQGGAAGTQRPDATGETQGYFGLGGHGGSAPIPPRPTPPAAAAAGGGLYGGGGGGSSGGGAGPAT